MSRERKSKSWHWGGTVNVVWADGRGAGGPGGGTGRVIDLGAAEPDRLDIDGKPFCPSGYAQRYHAIDQCDCTPEAQ